MNDSNLGPLSMKAFGRMKFTSFALKKKMKKVSRFVIDLTYMYIYARNLVGFGLEWSAAKTSC